MNAKCKVKIKSDLLPAKFYGVFQISEIIPPSPITGGHGGGVVASPIAVVDYGDGLTRVDVHRIFDVEEDD